MEMNIYTIMYILFMTIKLLYYMTVFEKFGMFIKMLVTSIWEMIPFFLIFTLSIIWTATLNDILRSDGLNKGDEDG